MLIDFTLKNLFARLGVLALVVGGLIALTAASLNGFVVGALTDTRAEVTGSDLQAAAQYCPNSARLEGRLAEAELMGPERDLDKAESDSQRAISLSPNSFGLRMISAAIKEAKGDRAGAEQALREAERLAPANGDVQWRLANLMLRQGNTEGSLDSFRVAIKANPGLLPAALDLVWRYSRGSSDELNRIVPDEPPLKVRLARFLIHQGRPSESLEVFNSIGARSSRACPESWDFLQDLLATENVGEARNVWLSLIGDKPGDESSAAVFNPGFESDPAPTRDQFDWKVTPTAAAQVFIDTGTFHSGGRSLRIEFVGHETTRLDGTVKELTVIKPGAHYKLEFYSRSENLVTSDGPRIALSSVAFPEWTAKSGPIAAGTSDWRSESVDFVAPGVKGGPAIPMIISFIRTPKLNYEEPMRGIVWLDDFSLNEVKQ